MPELPEVETVRRGGSAHLTGRRLIEVELRRKDLRWPIPVRRVRALRGRRCTEVARRSKYVLMHFDGAHNVVAQRCKGFGREPAMLAHFYALQAFVGAQVNLEFGSRQTHDA